MGGVAFKMKRFNINKFIRRTLGIEQKWMTFFNNIGPDPDEVHYCEKLYRKGDRLIAKTTCGGEIQTPPSLTTRQLQKILDYDLRKVTCPACKSRDEVNEWKQILNKT